MQEIDIETIVQRGREKYPDARPRVITDNGPQYHYNTDRLHRAIGYVTPHTKLAGKEKELFAQRDQKLEAARERLRLRRAEAIKTLHERPESIRLKLT